MIMEAEKSHHLGLQAGDPGGPVVKFSMSPKAWEPGEWMG